MSKIQNNNMGNNNQNSNNQFSYGSPVNPIYYNKNNSSFVDNYDNNYKNLNIN